MTYKTEEPSEWVSQIRPDDELRAKMLEVEGRVRRRLGYWNLHQWVVHVTHLDGSMQIYYNACARRWKGYLFVWTEHNGSHFYFIEDLLNYGMFKSVDVPWAR